MDTLKRARESAHMTQAQVATAAGVTPSFISLLESGRRRPTIDVGLRIALALGTTIDALFGGPPTLQRDRPASGE